MAAVSVEQVLSVVRDFEDSGGASLGLVAWELDVAEDDVAGAWDLACTGGLLERAGDDPLHGEHMWRLSRRGWAALGVDPCADRRRRDAVVRLGILDRIADPALIAITRIASYLAGGSAAAIHVFDERYERRIAAVNAPLETRPAYDALCRLVVDQDTPVVVTDVLADPRFAHSSLVTGAEPIRFYAAVPLRTLSDGIVVGTLCAFDTVPRELDDAPVEMLGELAKQVITHVEFTRLAIELSRLTTHDPVTGAANGLLLSDRLQAALARRKRHGGEVLVAVLTVDNLSEIAAEHDDTSSEAVLVEIVSRLGSAMRAADTIARLGAAEFAAIVETAAGADAEEIVRRLRVAAAAPIGSAGRPMPVQMSVCWARAEADDDARSALARAERGHAQRPT